MPLLPRKLWALLSRREHWQLTGLSILVIFTGVAQVAGVASIVPFIAVLINPETIHTNQWLRTAYIEFDFKSTDSFLMFLAIAIMAALVVANGFLALTQWILIRFTWALQFRLSRRLLEQYLAQEFQQFLLRNSADTVKNVISEVERLTTGVVLPFLRILTFSVAGILVMVTLVWANATLTFVVVFVLGGGYSVIYLAIRRAVASAGSRRIDANTERFKVVNEAFGSIKEIKVLGRESVMIDRYDGPALRFARAQVTYFTAALIPRYLMEVLAVGTVLSLALFLISGVGETIQDVAPLLALYAFAGLRLMPFLQQIYVGSSQIKFNSVVVDAIYDDITSKMPSRILTPSASFTGNRLPFKRELRVQGVTFSYPNSETATIRDVTLSIPHGSFVAFVGATGAGKSTFIDILLGLLHSNEGVLTVDDIVLDQTTMRAWQNNLGYVPQDIYLIDDTIAANIALGVPPGVRRLDAMEKAASVANIHEFIAQSLPNGYDTMVGERGVRLSGGQRQRIGIARALYHEPDVLVLDEATSNLDQITEKAVHKAIEQTAKVKTVILIAHRLSITRQCDAVYLFDQGRIVAHGSYDTLLASSDQFREMVTTKLKRE